LFIASKNDLGAPSRAVLVDGHTNRYTMQIVIIAQGGLEVCDAGYRCLVMKKGVGRSRRRDELQTKVFGINVFINID
jgi:hypothetical protein